MKWQLLGDWPVGQFIIPQGTIIDSEENGRDLPFPPLNAKALDQEAYDATVAHYTPLLTDNFLHTLIAAKGVVTKTEGQQ